MSTIAIYPGTFDPVTNGHVDLVRRASGMFDRIIVAVAASERKQPLFSLEQRVALAQQVLSDFPQVQVKPFTGLMVNMAAAEGAKVIIRGLRAVSDFDYEVQLASMNRSLQPDIETVYLSPDVKYTFVSSSLIKDVVGHGGDASQYIHPLVQAALKEKIK